MFGLTVQSLRKPPVLVVAAVLALAGGIGFYLLRTSGGDVESWLTAKAQRGDLEDTTTALGTFQPRDYVDVGTQVSGQLRRIFVQIGDAVTVGQPMAEIDPTLYGTKVDAGRAQLQSLHAQLAEKQSQLGLTKELYERQRRMRGANATSEEAFQSAEAAWKAAQAQVSQLRAQIQQIASTLKGDEANLGYTRIYAPMNGTVVTQPARQGQTINASQQAPVIMRIADLSTMTVWTQVSEADVNRLKIGQDVYFTTLGQPNRRWYGNLHQILPTPEVVNNVVLYNALFDAPNPDGTLGIQMSAQVFFVHDAAKDAVLVPVAALVMAEQLDRGAARSPGARKASKGPIQGTPKETPGPAPQAASKGEGEGTVLVMKDGKPTPRRVKIGVKNRVQAQIVSGLEAGEEVVIGVRRADARADAKGGAPRPPAPTPAPTARPRL